MVYVPKYDCHLCGFIYIYIYNVMYNYFKKFLEVHKQGDGSVIWHLHFVIFFKIKVEFLKILI